MSRLKEGADPATFKLFPLGINNQNPTLHEVRFNFEEFICREKLEEYFSFISVQAFIEEICKNDVKYQL